MMCHLVYFLSCKKRLLSPHPLKVAYAKRVWEPFAPYVNLSISFNISQRVSRHCSIPSNHPITYQRYKKGNRHTARSIRNIPHDYRSNRSTHYRHDKQRRSKLGLCTRIPQCQREDSRKHDALSQIQGEERNER